MFFPHYYIFRLSIVAEIYILPFWLLALRVCSGEHSSESTASPFGGDAQIFSTSISHPLFLYIIISYRPSVAAIVVILKKIAAESLEIKIKRLQTVKTGKERKD